MPKKTIFETLQETLHTTHLLKLFDKMDRYEMDPIRTVDATERTRDSGLKDRRADGRTDGRTDGVKQHSSSYSHIEYTYCSVYLKWVCKVA